MSVTIDHNPRCSKSRQTLALLEENGVKPTIVEYLTDTPTAGELKGILGLLGKSAKDILRTKEAKEEGIDAGALDEDALVAAMIAHPRVIERPIVVKDDKAAVGRPPESVLAIL